MARAAAISGSVEHNGEPFPLTDKLGLLSFRYRQWRSRSYVASMGRKGGSIATDN